MAMVLTDQKPTQRNRNDEVPEGLPGSTKSVACVERNVRNLGAPIGSCAFYALDLSITKGVQVGRTETTSREADDRRESDQPIVLRDGRAVHV
jgi:hypothetical protein